VLVEARWVLLSMIGAILSMTAIFTFFGFEKILGLGHIVAFTPVLIYLYMRRSQWRVSQTYSGKWIALAFAVMSVSLAFDTVDVIRWLVADHAT